MRVEELFAALLDSLSRARAISDGRSLEVGRLYRRHEVLQHFPVPRYTMSEVTIDLTCALAQADSGVVGREGGSRTDLLAFLRKRMETFPAALGLPEPGDAWRARLPELVSEVESWGPLDAPTHLREVAERLTTLLFGELRSLLASSERLTGAAQEAFSHDRESEYRDYLEVDLRSYLAHPEEAQGSAPLEVLFSPSDLRDVPESLLSTVRVVFRPVDRNWVADDLDGERIMRLK